MDLEELSKEYRFGAAKLAMAIKKHEQAQDIEPEQLAMMKRMLEDMRIVKRTIASYYTLPRPGDVDSSSWKAGKVCGDDN